MLSARNGRGLRREADSYGLHYVSISELSAATDVRSAFLHRIIFNIWNQTGDIHLDRDQRQRTAPARDYDPSHSSVLGGES